MTVYTIDSYFSLYDGSTYDTEYHYDELKTQVGIDATLKMKVEYLSEKNGAIISTINIDYGLTQNHFNILSEFWQYHEELSNLTEENQSVIVKRNTFPDYEFSAIAYNTIKEMTGSQNDTLTSLSSVSNQNLTGAMLVIRDLRTHGHTENSFKSIKEVLGL